MMNVDGSFTYHDTNSCNLLGLPQGTTLEDSFTYQISNGDGCKDTATAEHVAQVIQNFFGEGKVLLVKGSSFDEKIEVKFGARSEEFKVTLRSGSNDPSDMGTF